MRAWVLLTAETVGCQALTCRASQAFLPWPVFHHSSYRLSFVQTTAYIPSGKALDFDAILPADMSYVTFEGSLTTPPCTGGPQAALVQYLLCKTRLELAIAELLA